MTVGLTDSKLGLVKARQMSGKENFSIILQTIHLTLRSSNAYYVKLGVGFGGCKLRSGKLSYFSSDNN